MELRLELMRVSALPQQNISIEIIAEPFIILRFIRLRKGNIKIKVEVRLCRQIPDHGSHLIRYAIIDDKGFPNYLSLVKILLCDLFGDHHRMRLHQSRMGIPRQLRQGKDIKQGRVDIAPPSPRYFRPPLLPRNPAITAETYLLL